MKDTQRKRGASFHRVLDVIAEYPPTPAIPAATLLVTELNTTTTAFDTLAAEQDLAFGTVHGATVDRKQLKRDLVSFLKRLGETARVLDPVAHPGLAAEMRLGRATSSYGALVTRARAFHSALVPVKADFVGYGFAETVDADLLAMITAVDAATGRKNDGKAIHIGGTAGLVALCKTGVAIVRKLDAILSNVYKDDAVKYAAWKAARRVEREPRHAVEEPAPGGGGTPPSGGGGTPPSGS